MALDDIRTMPGHLIRRLQQTMGSLFLAEAGGDLTSVQFAALAAIADRPGTDASAVSSLIAVDRATTGGVIDRLLAKGLIRRSLSRADRRVKLLHVTPGGTRMLEVLLPGVTRAQDRLLAPLSPAERTDLMRLLGRLVEAHGSRIGPSADA